MIWTKTMNGKTMIRCGRIIKTMKDNTFDCWSGILTVGSDEFMIKNGFRKIPEEPPWAKKL